MSVAEDGRRREPRSATLPWRGCTCASGRWRWHAPSSRPWPGATRSTRTVSSTWPRPAGERATSPAPGRRRRPPWTTRMARSWRSLSQQKPLRRGAGRPRHGVSPTARWRSPAGPSTCCSPACPGPASGRPMRPHPRRHRPPCSTRHVAPRRWSIVIPGPTRRQPRRRSPTWRRARPRPGLATRPTRPRSACGRRRPWPNARIACRI